MSPNLFAILDGRFQQTFADCDPRDPFYDDVVPEDRPPPTVGPLYAPFLPPDPALQGQLSPPTPAEQRAAFGAPDQSTMKRAAK